MVFISLITSAASADTFEPTPLVRIPKATYKTCPYLNISYLQKTAEIPEFFLEQDEVTQRQYLACVKDGRCRKPKYHWPHPDQPVTGVSFHDAEAYCRWIGRRLPGYGEWWRALFPPDPKRLKKEPPAIDFSGRTYLNAYHLGPLYCPSFVIANIRGDKCGYRQPQIVLRVQERLSDQEKEELSARYRSPIVVSPAAQGYVDVAKGATYGYERGVYDLVGNVSEWLADWVPHDVEDFRKRNRLIPRREPKPPVPDLPEKGIAGGNFLNTSVPEECSTSGGPGAVDYRERRRELGFRCAADARAADQPPAATSSSPE